MEKLYLTVINNFLYESTNPLNQDSVLVEYQNYDLNTLVDQENYLKISKKDIVYINGVKVVKSLKLKNQAIVWFNHHRYIYFNHQDDDKLKLNDSTSLTLKLKQSKFNQKKDNLLKIILTPLFSMLTLIMMAMIFKSVMMVIYSMVIQISVSLSALFFYFHDKKTQKLEYKNYLQNQYINLQKMEQEISETIKIHDAYQNYHYPSIEQIIENLIKYHKKRVKNNLIIDLGKYPNRFINVEYQIDDYLDQTKLHQNKQLFSQKYNNYQDKFLIDLTQKVIFILNNQKALNQILLKLLYFNKVDALQIVDLTKQSNYLTFLKFNLVLNKYQVLELIKRRNSLKAKYNNLIVISEYDEDLIKLIKGNQINISLILLSKQEDVEADIIFYEEDQSLILTKYQDKYLNQIEEIIDIDPKVYNYLEYLDDHKNQESIKISDFLKPQRSSLDITKHIFANLGLDKHQHLVQLDLQEQVDGPHGLICGTTGSGKSELLITLITSLALNYSPDLLQIIIIDFKGQAMASSVEDIENVVCIVDNFNFDIQRFLKLLKAEIKRRQLLLLKYNLKHIDQLVRERLAHLILICDEFAEVKTSNSDIIDSLISLARVGRSLGIHLILSSQQIQGVVSDQILANSNFKIVLKLQDASESNLLLKSPIAAFFTKPGEAVLVSSNSYYQFRSFYLFENSSHYQIKDLTQQQDYLYLAEDILFNRLKTLISTQKINLFKVLANKYISSTDLLKIDDIENNLIKNKTLESENYLICGDGKSGKTNCLGQIIHLLLLERAKIYFLKVKDDNLNIYQDYLLTNRLNKLIDLRQLIHKIESEKNLIHVLIDDFDDLKNLDSELFEQIISLIKNKTNIRWYLTLKNINCIPYYLNLYFNIKIVLYYRELSEKKMIINCSDFANENIKGRCIYQAYNQTMMAQIVFNQAQTNLYQKTSDKLIDIFNYSYQIQKEEQLFIGISLIYFDRFYLLKKENIVIYYYHHDKLQLISQRIINQDHNYQIINDFNIKIDSNKPKIILVHKYFNQSFSPLQKEINQAYYHLYLDQYCLDMALINQQIKHNEIIVKMAQKCHKVKIKN